MTDQQINRCVFIASAIFTALCIVGACSSTAHADDHRRQRSENKNYILRRQEAYQVQGTPTDRIIVGRREIDVYRGPGGSKIMFEKDNVVGVTR